MFQEQDKKRILMEMKIFGKKKCKKMKQIK